MISSDFGYRGSSEKTVARFDPALGGGALLDWARSAFSFFDARGQAGSHSRPWRNVGRRAWMTNQPLSWLAAGWMVRALHTGAPTRRTTPD